MKYTKMIYNEYVSDLASAFGVTATWHSFMVYTSKTIMNISGLVETNTKAWPEYS